MMLMISAPRLAAAGATCKQGDRGVGVDAPEFRDHSHSHSTRRAAEDEACARVREGEGVGGCEIKRLIVVLFVVAIIHLPTHPHHHHHHDPTSNNPPPPFPQSPTVTPFALIPPLTPRPL